MMASADRRVRRRRGSLAGTLIILGHEAWSQPSTAGHHDGIFQRMIRYLTVAAALLVALGTSAGADPLKIVLLSGSEEYDSDRTLTAFTEYLEAHYPVDCTLLKAKGFEELPGLDALDDCDVALFFTRRLTIDGDQLQKVKDYALSGRPIVALRTASHGFQNWLEFDKVVLGGNYHNHLSNDKTTRLSIAPGARDHPILDGIVPFATAASLYRTSPLAEGTTLLMTGQSPEGNEPVAWTRDFKGARIVYTSLGAPGDFENATFRRMLINALFWAAGREVEHPMPGVPPARARPEGTLHLALRSRVEPFKGSGDWRVVELEREFPVAETAIVLCDMWDRHWCRGATERCDAIAARMAPVIDAAREAGVLIVHAPSECMPFYAGTPQRLRAQHAPKASPPPAVELPPEPPLPIDDSDGGCDTDDAMYLAWTRENPRLAVGPPDVVSDDGDEIYNVLAQERIKNLLVMGVHTNMCVLNRSFAIRAMTRRGVRCVLVRDMTDTMYDPKDRPYVPHDEGTALVVEHIEKYWCPSTTGAALVEGLPK